MTDIDVKLSTTPQKSTDAGVTPLCGDAKCAEEGERASLPPALSRLTATLLSRSAQKMRELFECRIAHLGLRSKHYGVLVLLQEEPLTQVEIGRGLWVDRTTMVSLIDELEHLGLVERGRHPADRRAYAVTLTELGRRVLEEATGIVEASETEFFASLEPVEREQLRALLNKLL